MSMCISSRDVFPFRLGSNDRNIARGAAVQLIDSLRRELVHCPPDSIHRDWIRDKILRYEQLLKSLGEDGDAA